MHLVQLLIPTEGLSAQGGLSRITEELLERFGGLTAYTRTPVHGEWIAPSGERTPDEIIVVEVMTDAIDKAWWHDYGRELAKRLEQEEVVIRAHQVERL